MQGVTYLESGSFEVNKFSYQLQIQFSSVQFSRSVVSDSLRPHESQHARPPCPSPSPGVHSDSYRLEIAKVKIRSDQAYSVFFLSLFSGKGKKKKNCSSFSLFTATVSFC